VKIEKKGSGAIKNKLVGPSMLSHTHPSSHPYLSAQGCTKKNPHTKILNTKFFSKLPCDDECHV
jgi:hypothetical protein